MAFVKPLNGIGYGYVQATSHNSRRVNSPSAQEIQNISLRLQKIIRDILPEVDENVSGGKKMVMALYSFDNPNIVICGIQPTETMCKLFFHGWEALKNKDLR
ncbi:hypothetical protein [Fodinibius sp. Rm-B-1B1-1]|uniref:hypothetical protein n=1 Tax=Fodinibius alkaliphilus TaxID=3140241 RepID=UPI00315A7B2B